MRENEQNTCELKEKLLLARRLFLSGKPVPEGLIAPHVLHGWEISQKRGTDPPRTRAPSVPDENALEKLKKKDAALLEAAGPTLSILESSIRDTGYIAALAAPGGRLLAVVGDDALAAQAHEQRSLSKEERGITAAGLSALSLCMLERRPVSVSGYEHHNRNLRDWRCAAAPIFACDGKLAGSLTLSSRMSRRDMHTMALACSCAEAIGLRMREAALLERQKRLNALLESVQNALPELILAVSREGTITQANERAKEHFNCMGDIVGLHIRRIFSGPALPRVQSLLEVMEPGSLEAEVASRNGTDNRICRFVPIRPKDGPALGMTISISTHGRMIDMAKPAGGNYARYSFEDIKGESPAIKEQIALAKKAAASNHRILLTGESGTGKELFAQSIHNAGSASLRPFVAISCAAIPRELIESELFGYVGGAFTGARRNGMVGKMELAAGGTLFLDEINCLPLEMQGKLLRALQQMEVVRIGDTRPTPVNARVIAAANRDLYKAVQEGLFRGDLYFRLNVVEIRIPPLRERPGDISLLAHTFLRRQSRETGRPFRRLSTEALGRLCAHPWPGNIRELDNACERALLLSEDGVIQARHLPPHIAGFGAQALAATRTEGASAKDIYKALIQNALQRNNGNISKAAAQLGVARSTLYRNMRRFGITKGNTD